MSGTILGIGPLEILLIVILVLLVFGPERLPGLMRQAGQGVRRLRDFYVNLSKDLRTELEPFQEEIRVLQDVTNELRRDLEVIREAADIRTAIPPIAIDGSKPAAAGAAAAAAVKTTPAKAPATTATPAATPGAGEGTGGGPQKAAAPGRMLPAPNGSGLDLGDDNPWAQLNRAARSDALDKDNPWAL